MIESDNAIKAYLHKTQHARCKSQRRHSQLKAVIITTDASDWLSYLRCDPHAASNVDGHSCNRVDLSGCDCITR